MSGYNKNRYNNNSTNNYHNQHNYTNEHRSLDTGSSKTPSSRYNSSSSSYLQQGQIRYPRYNYRPTNSYSNIGKHHYSTINRGHPYYKYNNYYYDNNHTRHTYNNNYNNSSSFIHSNSQYNNTTFPTYKNNNGFEHDSLPRRTSSPRTFASSKSTDTTTTTTTTTTTNSTDRLNKISYPMNNEKKLDNNVNKDMENNDSETTNNNEYTLHPICYIVGLNSDTSTDKLFSIYDTAEKINTRLDDDLLSCIETNLEYQLLINESERDTLNVQLTQEKLDNLLLNAVN